MLSLAELAHVLWRTDPMRLSPCLNFIHSGASDLCAAATNGCTERHIHCDDVLQGAGKNG